MIVLFGVGLVALLGVLAMAIRDELEVRADLKRIRHTQEAKARERAIARLERELGIDS